MCILVFLGIRHALQSSGTVHERALSQVPSNPELQGCVGASLLRKNSFTMHESICIDSYGGSCVVQWLVCRRAIVQTQGLDKL